MSARIAQSIAKYRKERVDDRVESRTARGRVGNLIDDRRARV